ncbi:MAG TPA: cytochrome c [Pseudolabrys sp.]|nr:cytochrome c [Pseudolabrys sp.]
MCTPSRLVCAALMFFTVAGIALAQTAPAKYGFGSPVGEQELSKYFAIPPDGRGLPPGSGNAAAGAKIYATNCAACHGEKLEGNPAKGIGGDKLIGGRGSLATKTPVKTVESYWPYATTLFDYIKRSMPFSSPGSLSDDDVYSVVAYILSEAKIIQPSDTMDATSLPKVRMPNRDGFIPDPRPELELYH